VKFLRKLVQGALRSLGFELTRIRPETGSVSYSNFGEDALIAKYLAQSPPAHRYCVDIGAGDGETSSNSCKLFRDGWEGLALEYSGPTFSRLAYRYSDLNRCSLGRFRVTPDNVVSLLKAAEAPEDFGFLSLDIDSYDHFVLEKILEVYRPSLMCVEINEKIPPPVKFAVQWRPDHSWTEDHFYGQSLEILAELAGRFQYTLVDLEYNNAFLLPSKAVTAPPRPVRQVYEDGYLKREDRLKRLPWNKDMEPLHALKPEGMISFINEKFAKYQGRYVCRL
jgi:hypothetical protein